MVIDVTGADPQVPLNHPNASPQACSPGHLPDDPREIVERLHGRFLEALQVGLDEVLQLPITALFHESVQAPFSRILDTPATAGCLVALDLAPVQGCAILSFPSGMLARVLDVLLGAPSDTSQAPRGAITEIELHILGEFFHVIADALRTTWAPVSAMAFEPIAAGTEAVRKVASAASNVAIVVSSKLSIGDSEEIFEIAIPGFAARLAEINSREAALSAGETKPLDQRLLAALDHASLRVETVLRGSSIQMKDLLSMREGQIFLMKTPLEAPFDCLVNGKPQFTGHMIANGSRHGFQIAEGSPGISSEGR